MKFILSILFTVSIIIAQAQETSLHAELLHSFNAGTDRYIGTDNFGYTYTIGNNEFRKQKNGKTTRFKAVTLGDIYSVDLQNPLQIVLFYKDFNTVVLLDNQLNETTRINFSQLNQPIVAEGVGLASQNRIWVYDTNTQQVGLYSLIPNTFKTLTPPFNKKLKYHQSDYNYFYWADETNNLYAVNLFGKVSFLGELPAYDQMELISAKKVLLKKDNILYMYNLQEATYNKIEIAEKSFLSFHYTAQILSIFTDNKIIQYNIILPK